MKDNDECLYYWLEGLSGIEEHWVLEVPPSAARIADMDDSCWRGIFI